MSNVKLNQTMLLPLNETRLVYQGGEFFKQIAWLTYFPEKIVLPKDTTSPLDALRRKILMRLPVDENFEIRDIKPSPLDLGSLVKSMSKWDNRYLDAVGRIYLSQNYLPDRMDDITVRNNLSKLGVKLLNTGKASRPKTLDVALYFYDSKSSVEEISNMNYWRLEECYRKNDNGIIPVFPIFLPKFPIEYSNHGFFARNEACHELLGCIENALDELFGKTKGQKLPTIRMRMLKELGKDAINKIKYFLNEGPYNKYRPSEIIIDDWDFDHCCRR